MAEPEGGRGGQKGRGVRHAPQIMADQLTLLQPRGRLLSPNVYSPPRVSVQGVKSLGGHFARLCRGFEFYEVKKNCYYFSKRKWKQ